MRDFKFTYSLAVTDDTDLRVRADLTGNEVTHYYDAVLAMLAQSISLVGDVSKVWDFYPFGTPSDAGTYEGSLDEDSNFLYPGDAPSEPVLVFDTGPDTPTLIMYRYGMTVSTEKGVAVLVGRMD